MNKRIRTALAALLIAFAIAFNASQLGGLSQFDLAGIQLVVGSGGIMPIAGVKPPKGVAARFINDATGLALIHLFDLLPVSARSVQGGGFELPTISVGVQRP
jgi:hypothetical protein